MTVAATPLGGTGPARVVIDLSAVATAPPRLRIVIDFEPRGYAYPVTGSARKLVKLGQRDCATDRVAARITRDVAKRASSVTIRVDGRRVVTLKGRALRARVLALPVAAGADAEVTTRVVLKRKGRVLTGSRAYLACS